jgi:hypothetical protein
VGEAVNTIASLPFQPLSMQQYPQSKESTVFTVIVSLVHGYKKIK